MKEQKDIEIKNIDITNIVIPTKKTLYLCVCWCSNGTIFTNCPSEEKKYQVDYALSMSKYAEHTCIYKFDIDIPNLKTELI